MICSSVRIRANLWLKCGVGRGNLSPKTYILRLWTLDSLDSRLYGLNRTDGSMSNRSYCKNCGEELTGSKKYCLICGSAQEGVEDTLLGYNIKCKCGGETELRLVKRGTTHVRAWVCKRCGRKIIHPIDKQKLVVKNLPTARFWNY